MTLYINGCLLRNPSKTLDNFESFAEIYENFFKDGALTLRKMHQRHIKKADNVLYVNQREFAVLANNDAKNISKLGSDMATTCHMVVLRCPATKITALGHFDGVATNQGVNDMVDAVLKEVIHASPPRLEGIDLDLHIIGGFNDSRKLSEQLSLELLEEFNSYRHKRDLPKAKLHLKTYCACSLNNKPVNKRFSMNAVGQPARKTASPVVFGILVDAGTGEIGPVTFDDEAKEPESDLRSARSLNCVRVMTSIYRTRESCFVLEPFTYDEMKHIEDWVIQPNEVLRKYMSTSPEVEPVNFEDHIRRTLKFIHDNPDPMETVFREKKALIFDPEVTDVGLVWKKRIY